MAAKRTPVVSLQPLLLGLGFALLVVISAATVYLVDRAADDLQRLTQTLRVEDQLSNVLLDVRRAESSQRGYLFTNNQDYLKEFYEAEPQARQLLAELRTLTKDNPARQAMLDEATKLIDAKFKEMSATVVLSQQGRRDEARNLVLTGAGRTIADQLRKMIDGAISDEAHLAATRRDQSRQTNRMLLYVTLAGAAVIVIIGILSIVLVQRNMREREATQKEIESTNANLERIVEYRTADLTEANEEIQRFAYIVSHDLRSPLVNIMGFTSELEALRKDIFEQIGKLSAQIAALDAQAAAATAEGQIDQLGEEFDEAIRFIKTSISNMDRLINAVLRLSREGRRVRVGHEHAAVARVAVLLGRRVDATELVVEADVAVVLAGRVVVAEQAHVVGVDADEVDVLEQREVGDRLGAELDVHALVAAVAHGDDAVADLLVDGAQAEVAQLLDVGRLEVEVDDLLDRRDVEHDLEALPAHAVAAVVDDRRQRAGEVAGLLAQIE